MHEATNLLKEWTDFYVIVGSSAGALTGLQFVVIALLSEGEGKRSMLEIRAFGTPRRLCTSVWPCSFLGLSARLGRPHRPLHGVWESAELQGWRIR